MEALGAQHLIQVSQSRHRGNQINLQGLAIGIQLQNVFWRQGSVIPPDFAEAVKQEGVLNIQMQLIDLIETAPVCQLFQKCQCGNPAPRDVIEEAPGRKGRPVLQAEVRQHQSFLSDHLPQGLYAVQQSCIPAAGNQNACGGNLNFIALTIQARLLHLLQADARVGGVHAPVNQQCDASLFLQLPSQELGEAISRRTARSVQGNSVLVTDAVPAFQQLQLLWLWNQSHGRFLLTMRRFRPSFYAVWRVYPIYRK